MRWYFPERLLPDCTKGIIIRNGKPQIRIRHCKDIYEYLKGQLQLLWHNYEGSYKDVEKVQALKHLALTALLSTRRPYLRSNPESWQLKETWHAVKYLVDNKVGNASVLNNPKRVNIYLCWFLHEYCQCEIFTNNIFILHMPIHAV